MTFLKSLTVNYEEILFEINTKHEDTVMDLKYSIYTVTGLKPSQQMLPALDLQGNSENNHCKLRLLNLHQECVLRVIKKFGTVCSVLTLKLKVEWQNIFFILDVEEIDTIMDLKFMISKATGIKLSRQSFANLNLCGELNDNDYAMQHLDLDRKFVLKVKEDFRLLKTLQVQWENKLFKIEIARGVTVFGVKSLIYTATGLESTSQVFLNLSLPDGVKEEDYFLEALNLQSDFLLKIGSKPQEPSSSSSANSLRNCQKISSECDSVISLIENLNESCPKATGVKEQPSSAVEKDDKKSNSNGCMELNKPRPGKKLVVLDIDHTILDYHASNMRFAARPFLQVFLKGIYEKFDIGVWSATNMDVAVVKLSTLGMLTSPHYKILFCMDLEAMTHVMVNRRQSRVKALRNIWTRYPQFTQQNTVICDDQKINFALNKNNGILIAPYRAANHGADKELVYLLAYLKRIAHFEDLTVFDHGKWRKPKYSNSDTCSNNENSGSSDEEGDSD